MASRSTNTMQEALQKTMRDIADMKLLPDADVPFLVEMETSIMNYFKRPIQEMQNAGQLPQSPGPAQIPGLPSGPGGGMPAGSPMGGGAMAGPKAPNTDELSRLLTAGA